MIPPAERASTTVEEGTARTNFWVGVILSIIADAIIAVSLNVQKTAHMRNEVRNPFFLRDSLRWKSGLDPASPL